MTALLVADMASYLAAAGWQVRPDTWRGASIWDHPGGYEVLVPGRDGMDDAEDRSWELLATLAKVESRTLEEVADDVASPTMDTQSFRTFPPEMPSGYIALRAGLRALQGIRDLLGAAARAEAEGPRADYPGDLPPSAKAMLDDARLAPSRPGSYVLTVRTPIVLPDQPDLFGEDREPFSRRALTMLHGSVAAAHDAVGAVRTGADYSAFDEVVDSGVSAGLCKALSDLAGMDRRQPFEIGFRWARSLPTELGPQTISFPHNAGTVLFDAAKQLQRLAMGGPAEITGLIDSLHDEQLGADRWRVRVRGQLTTARGDVDARRLVWVRLGEASYQHAIEAHRNGRSVRARGRLEPVQGRVELLPGPDGFAVLK